MVHILVVEDDDPIRQLLADYLTREGYRVSVAATGAMMTQVLAERTVDLILLDLRLPDADGLSQLRRLRSSSPLPVIILSGKADEVDRIVGLEMGADDYLTKPFSPRELVARIRAVLRRTAEERQRSPGDLSIVVTFAGWEFDLTAHWLRSPDGRLVELTKGESALLSAFVKRPRQVLTREQLLDLTHGAGGEAFERSIDVLILRLRRKIEANPREPRIIRTERGAGYRLDATVGSR